MPPLRQLEFVLGGQALRLPWIDAATPKALGAALPVGHGTDLTAKACQLLHSLGATRLARDIRVEWNPRLQTAAGRADYREQRISLNPRLREHPVEVERTLRHELAHILAQFRAGRRRISPHGVEWRQACRDLGIEEENRCHTLPFPVKHYTPRFVYRCPNCRRDFPRVRKIRRPVACLACCRARNGGEFDPRFRLKLAGTARRPCQRPCGNRLKKISDRWKAL